jgi:CheY-like chemotaxis protein
MDGNLSATPAPAVDPHVSLNPVRVMVVDDSPAVCSALEALLIKLPRVTVVKTVNNGTEAVEHLQSLKPDVLILDLKMPGLSGFEVMRRMGQDGWRPFLIVFTSYTADEFRKPCLALGADHFISKPAFESVMGLIQQFRDTRSV